MSNRKPAQPNSTGRNAGACDTGDDDLSTHEQDYTAPVGIEQIGPRTIDENRNQLTSDCCKQMINQNVNRLARFKGGGQGEPPVFQFEGIGGVPPRKEKARHDFGGQ